MTEPYTIVSSHFHENDNIRSIILDKIKNIYKPLYINYTISEEITMKISNVETINLIHSIKHNIA